MSGHTPGPWVWLEPMKVLNSAHGKVIDHAHYEGMWFAAYDKAKDEANARLIAAAPVLLAEVEREYAELADIRNQWLGRCSLDGQAKLCRLRDLIAKATGRDPEDVQDEFSARAAADAFPDTLPADLPVPKPMGEEG